MEGAMVARARSGEGPLSGLTFAVKDNIALRGHRSSAGHPAWAATHPQSAEDAPVVARLLAAGADLVGVTIMDELAYSLAGQNIHYGTPTSVIAPGRLCGGSSCGSAAAAAARLCDFALGTDTAGSVRVPAAFCRLFGLRPSHGRISTRGVVPLAPSFDTVGFLAGDALTFAAVGQVLLGMPEVTPPTRIVVADDAFALCDAGVLEIMEDALSRVARALGVKLERVELAPEGFEPLRRAVRRLEARELWETHGEWLTTTGPVLSPALAPQVAMAHGVFLSEEGAAEDNAVRIRITHRLDSLLTPGTLLAMPPAPGLAPRVDTDAPQLEAFRARTLELTAGASLAGVPQLVVPCADIEEGPLGLSFLARRGADAWLSSLAPELARALGL
jgi:amidase